jgi:hypothetical protein
MLSALTFGSLIAFQNPKIEFDTKQLENLVKFTKEAERLAKIEYPKTADVLGIPRTGLADVKVIIDFNATGVAYADGKTIHVAAKYASAHPDDTGLVVHELCHVAQHYPKYDPVWLVEGIADYVRWFAFEPLDKRPKIKKAKADARASYRTTGAFIDWTLRTYDNDIVKKLNKSLQESTYAEADWKTLTGKTLDELNEQWKASLSE